VQRRFTKRLHGLRNLPYTERLRLLNLQSLEVRRLYFDLILCYRIVFGLVSVNIDDFFQLNNASTRGHPYKLYKRFIHCRARMSFFSTRAVTLLTSSHYRHLRKPLGLLTFPNTSVTHIHNMFSHFCLFIYLYSCMSYYYVLRLSSFILRITVSAIYLALCLLFSLCMSALHCSVNFSKLNDDDN